ncbi:MAG: sugar phosphate isomerase/epimerase [Abditibacteriota bacterium]|nr:sugar phosphate isomerase/epimerase [Abditibacteriota bacterium]
MIGVSSYSFGHYFKDLGVKGIMEKAKEIGYEAFEFAELGVESDQKDQVELAKKYRDYAGEAGLVINNLATGADLVNYRGSATTLEEEIERIKGRVDVAEALGSKKMRHDIAWAYKDSRSLKAFFEILPSLAYACREVTKYAEQKGIKTMFENHGFFVQNADRVITLLEEVNYPNFGLLLDMGNFICADDNNLNSVKICAKYAFHVHAKDFIVANYENPDREGWFRSSGGTLLQGCALGEGVINPQRCIEILKHEGYNGDFSLEYEGPGDNIEGIKKGYALMKAEC